MIWWQIPLLIINKWIDCYNKSTYFVFLSSESLQEVALQLDPIFRIFHSWKTFAPLPVNFPKVWIKQPTIITESMQIISFATLCFWCNSTKNGYGSTKRWPKKLMKCRQSIKLVIKFILQQLRSVKTFLNLLYQQVLNPINSKKAAQLNKMIINLSNPMKKLILQIAMESTDWLNIILN